MNCVLLGYGTVGKSVEQLCKDHDDLNLEHIFVRPAKAAEPYLTSRGKEIVCDPQTDLVFECLNGLEPANTLITLALKNGKHVVSSNKAVMSKYLPEYLDLAKKHGGSVQIEASVGGGIPIVDALAKLSRAEELSGMDGILNGTSNYILDQMECENLPFETALELAKEKGYAEADPTNDIEGIDVWYKTLIAASLVTGCPIGDLPAPIGISKINFSDIELAKKSERTIRHLAMIRNESGKYCAIVAPVFLPKSDFFASVHQNYNAQQVYAPSFEKLGYYGQGAGGLATAQAMIADALDASDHRIRPIVLDKAADLDPDLIRCDWIVRTAKGIGSEEIAALTGARVMPMYGKSSKNDGSQYLLVENASLDQARSILKKDPEAMLVVWK